MIKIYTEKNVFDATMERIRKIFDEFKDGEIVVNISGGKDSQLLAYLTEIVAEEKNKKFYLFFLDEEANFTDTYETIKRTIKELKMAIPLWFQVEILETISSANDKIGLILWDKKREEYWIRKKEDFSIKELKKSKEPIDFYDGFKLCKYEYFGNKKVATLVGLRAKENLRRLMGVFNFAYNNIPYSSRADAFEKAPHYYNFYPLYDWEYSDVWKAIYELKIPYNPIYDKMYAYGFNENDMRVSSILHEISSRRALRIIRMIEPELYDKLIKRFENVAGFVHLLEERQFPISLKTLELPKSFSSWEQFCWFILENGNFSEDVIKRMKSNFNMLYNSCRRYNVDKEKMFKIFIYHILIADWDGTTLKNFITSEAIKYGRAKEKNIRRI